MVYELETRLGKWPMGAFSWANLRIVETKSHAKDCRHFQTGFSKFALLHFESSFVPMLERIYHPCSNCLRIAETVFGRSNQEFINAGDDGRAGRDEFPDGIVAQNGWALRNQHFENDCPWSAGRFAG